MPRLRGQSFDGNQPVTHCETTVELEQYFATDPDSNCLLWTGYVDPNGRPRVVFQGSLCYVHRLAYALYHRLPWRPYERGVPRPLIQTCSNKLCGARDHLRPARAGTEAAKRQFGGTNRAKTHCPHGHPYTDDNVYRRGDGARVCKTCMHNRDFQKMYQLKLLREGARTNDHQTRRPAQL